LGSKQNLWSINLEVRAKFKHNAILKASYNSENTVLLGQIGLEYSAMTIWKLYVQVDIRLRNVIITSYES